MSNDTFEIKQLFEELKNPSDDICLAAMKRVREEDIRDERILAQLRAIAEEDKSLEMRRAANQTLIELARPRTSPEPVMMARTLKLLEQQQATLKRQEKTLSELQNRVGCIYQFVSTITVLIVISLVLSFCGA